MSNSAITQQVQGLATPTSPGLVGTDAQSFAGKKTLDGGAAIKGDTTGNAIASGYVGEQLSQVNTGAAVVTTGYTTVSTLTLTNGIWLVSAAATQNGGGSITGMNARLVQKGVAGATASSDLMQAAASAGAGPAATFPSRIVNIAPGDATKTVAVDIQSVGANTNANATIIAVRIA
jgi:hypothetical protein